jgi:hypothetical protein
MSAKYIASLNGKIVGKRISNIVDKTYTHAIVAWGHGMDPHVVAWASRLDLAQGQKRKYQHWGFQAEIVSAVVVSKKESGK